MINEKSKNYSKTSENDPLRKNVKKNFELSTGVRLNLAFLPAGNFLMGQTEYETKSLILSFGREWHEKWCERELPRHSVLISKNFLMAESPITVEQFSIFIKETGYKTDSEKADWAYIWTGKEWEKTKGIFWQCDVHGENILNSNPDQPVIYVSWYDAVEYCKWLTVKYKKNFRLPTEAEWEYACRAGSELMIYSGNINFTGSLSVELDEIAWYSENCRANETTSVISTDPEKIKLHTKQSGPQTVRQKKPNIFGLYDMIGNVWEWCSDWYDEEYYSISPTNDPAGPELGSQHVLRGGSWFGDSRDCRAAFRGGKFPDYRSYDIGFRVIMEI